MGRPAALVLGLAALVVLAGFAVWLVYTVALMARRAKARYDKR